MITVGNYTEDLQQGIEEGKVLKEKGGVALISKQEAINWANSNLGVGNYQLYNLCDCEQDSYVDDPTSKYPTKKRLVKRVKMSLIK